MTELHSVKVPAKDERVEVWLAVGLTRPFRVVSLSRTYGEFLTLEGAQSFMRLLLLGNEHLKELV